jgi:hypothetical protein
MKEDSQIEGLEPNYQSVTEDLTIMNFKVNDMPVQVLNLFKNIKTLKIYGKQEIEEIR